MSTNGILDFQNTNKVIFRGTDSNVVVDTSNASIGIGIQGTEKPGSNLHVIGDASISSNLKLTTDTSIIVNSNVVTDFNGPHGRGVAVLKKYPEIALSNICDRNDLTDTYVQAGYTVSASSANAPTYSPIKAFNGIISGNDAWTVSGSPYQDENGGDPGAYNAGTYSTTVLMPTSTSIPGEYIQIKLPHKIKPTKFTVASYSVGENSLRQPNSGVFAGSNDGTTWYKLVEYSNETTWTHKVFKSFIVTDNIDSTYEYVRFIIRRVGNPNDHSGVTLSDGSLSIHGLEVYGYEEDPPAGDTSIDTTFKSVMNTPQTTGANVYVDAKLSSDFTNQVTGPTPVGPAVTHDNTNKYWEMNGQLTSNITVEANTFLEGDQPHAVSVWFNSSNLEANVSNTCVFSIASEEKLDSVNLDLQSNTWHNLTYSYQGEGGSRVTYLDGRKVAEEQAEDTFGDYPPFAMTGYSQGGYVVSSSTDNYTSGDFKAWRAFNDVDTAHEGWHGGTGDGTTLHYAANGDGSVYDPSLVPAGYSTSIGGIDGEWIKLEMPHKLVVDYVTLKSRGTTTASTQSPKDFKILGSNDDVNWDILESFTSVPYSLTGENHVVGATKGYKYIAMVVTRLQRTTLGDVVVGEISYYGHRENDLVHLPDPTNVLKYPHIAMTGPARRGYVASASSDNNGNNPAYKVFDHSTSDGWSTSGTYTPSGGFGIPTNSPPTLNGTGVPGEYLILQLPHKLRFSSVKLMPRNTNTDRCAESGNIYGSDDGTNWQLITSFSGKTYTSGNFTTIDINASTAYYRFAIVVTRIGNTANGVNTSIGEMELYGTGVDSIPIQIGGGNIDKVANFRVYDRFIEEDQALEIWDAQKDEFGRAKSSMTLHKGRLGIGTTEPEGRLAVLDEPNGLEEFPPRAMTGEETHFEGHGTFKVALSSADNGNGVIPAFNKKATLSDPGDIDYIEWGASQYTSATGVYTGSVSTQGVYGEWIEIQMPYKIKLEYNLLYHRNRGGTITNDYWVLERMPRDGAILGSNDGENWTTLQSWTDFEWVTGTSAAGQRQSEYWLTPGKFVTNSTAYYKTFRLVFSKLFGANGDRVNLAEWRLFGTREQGQSILHDGQLTLTKSLNVPRIGPALDADDTPRRDRLVVEYNTSTNPTFEGAVRDTSGRGFDGIHIGSNRYNADLKAFTGFSNANYIRTNISLFRGNVPHTHSVWFKLTSDNDNWNTVINLGQNGSGNGDQSAITWDTTNNRLWLNTYIGGVYVDLAAVIDKWYHVVATNDGSGAPSNSTMKIYVDGVKQTTVDSGNGAGGSIDVTGDYLTIGLGRASDGTIRNVFNGAISNYKLYDTVLTATEAKTLYDMGRCDEGHHLVNFSKTRIGIGLGDGDIGDGAYGSPGASALTIRGNQEIKGDIVLQGADSGVIFNQGSSSKWKIIHGGGTGAYSQLHFKRYYHIGGGINGWGDGGYISWDGHFIDNFTGQHKTFIKDVPFSQADDLYGLIVSSDQNKYIKMSDGIEAGSNAITMNESLPVVSLSNVVTDKRCFGVISASEDPENRTEQYGAWGTRFEKEKGDTRVYINSVGEGAIWVVNTNGSLESGDYITTSNVAGYGQKQDSAGLMNYTVAKITMDCDFNPATRPIQIIKKDEEGENILDEHEQIQWEDHPTDTEKAYKIRYLDAQGAQTDEANAVHIAAFVGCTYHCG